MPPVSRGTAAKVAVAFDPFKPRPGAKPPAWLSDMNTPDLAAELLPLHESLGACVGAAGTYAIPESLSVFRFGATMEKPEGEKSFGIAYEAVPDGAEAVVLVDFNPDGPMGTWNRSVQGPTPELRVRRGDRIVRANGVEGSREAITSVLRNAAKVQLTLERFPEQLVLSFFRQGGDSAGLVVERVPDEPPQEPGVLAEALGNTDSGQAPGLTKTETETRITFDFSGAAKSLDSLGQKLKRMTEAALPPWLKLTGLEIGGVVQRWNQHAMKRGYFHLVVPLGTEILEVNGLRAKMSKDDTNASPWSDMMEKELKTSRSLRIVFGRRRGRNSSQINWQPQSNQQPPAEEWHERGIAKGIKEGYKDLAAGKRITIDFKLGS